MMPRSPGHFTVVPHIEFITRLFSASEVSPTPRLALLPIPCGRQPSLCCFDSSSSQIHGSPCAQRNLPAHASLLPYTLPTFPITYRILSTEGPTRPFPSEDSYCLPFPFFPCCLSHTPAHVTPHVTVTLLCFCSCFAPA